MGEITKLIGNDGYVCLGEIGSELVGNATSDFDTLAAGGVGSGKGFYQVTAIASSSSIFDWTGAKVGDYFWTDGTKVMATGDKAKALPTAVDASVKQFQISLSKQKIDTTALSDPMMTYRMGKTDASGSFTGITTIGNYLVLDRFIERMDVSSAGAFSMTRISKQPFYFVGFLQSDETSGETLLAVVGKVEPESSNLGAQDGSAQEFSTNFSPTAGDKLQLVAVALA